MQKKNSIIESLVSSLSYSHAQGDIRKKIQAFLDAKQVEISHIHLEQPEEISHGDYATNIAFQLAGKLKTNPQIIGEELAEFLSKDDFFDKVVFAKPGFVNCYLSKQTKLDIISEIITKRENFGDSSIGEGKSIEIEFISANPTGPLTFPNARAGFTGDVLARVYEKIGFDAIKEYYINDYGNQVIKLGKSVEEAYKKLQGIEVDNFEDGYKGEYIEDIAKKLLEERSDFTLKEITEKALKINIESIKKTTHRMGITYDVWFSEKTLHDAGKVDDALETLKSNNKVYEKEGASWMKTTEYGDDKDRVVIKSDGAKTYVMADIAYHINKFTERNFDVVINIWGADHHSDVIRLNAGVNFVGIDESRLEILLTAMIKMTKDGKEVKISKRAGTYILMDDVLDQMPTDVLRYFSLMYDLKTPMTLDMDLALDTSERNPLYYVQYAHARMASILSKADQQIATNNLQALSSQELQIVNHLIEFPEVIELVARTKEVHHLPHYALKLSKAFHKYYHDYQVISDDAKTTSARLALVSAVKTTLKNTLELIGVEAPEKM